MKLFNSVVLLICFQCTSTFDPSYYCKKELRCEMGSVFEEHTVCRRKSANCKPVAGCTNLPLTNDEKQAIIDKHNELRSNIANGLEKRGYTGPQPKAANMRVLNYNTELEYIAQCHANICEFKHDVCRRTRDFPYVGQNIGYRGSTKEYEFAEYLKSHLKTVQNWYDEVVHFSASSVKKYGKPMGKPNEMLGHYTQLVWAVADNIGCARVLYDKNGMHNHMIVCNYGSLDGGGNIRGEPIYIEGPPCSQCPKALKCNKKYPGLCGTDIPIGKSASKDPGKPVPTKSTHNTVPKKPTKHAGKRNKLKNKKKSKYTHLFDEKAKQYHIKFDNNMLLDPTFLQKWSNQMSGHIISKVIIKNLKDGSQKVIKNKFTKNDFGRYTYKVFIDQ